MKWKAICFFMRWIKKISRREERKLRWDVKGKKDAFKGWWLLFIVRIQLSSINGIERDFGMDLDGGLECN